MNGKPALSTQRPLDDDGDELSNEEIEFKEKFDRWYPVGWKTGYESDPDAPCPCPCKDDPQAKRYWEMGLEDGFDALIKVEGKQRKLVA